MAASVDDSIVLTGCGWVTPFAAGSITTVLAAAPAVGDRTTGDEGYWAIPDDALADHPALTKELQSNKGAWVTALALEHARREARLERESVLPPRVGLVLGCALAGQTGMIDFADEVREQSARFVSPIHFPQTVGNYIAGALARGYNIRGPNATIAGGVGSGLDALIQADHLLRSGEADVVFAGGTDCVSKILARGLSKPDHGATPLSQGACLFVVERATDARARAAPPLATVTQSCHSAVGAPTADRIADGIADGVVSVAGTRRAGALWIEHWVGRCFAALGVGAAAAAIGAAGGAEVPLVTAADSIAIEKIAAGASTRALIIADADAPRVTTLELSVTPG